MKRLLPFLFCVFILFAYTSCDAIEDLSDSSIPETSVFEPLSAARVTAISIREPLFAQMYASMKHSGIHNSSDDFRRRHSSVTYSGLFELYKLGSESTNECKELKRKFNEEWESHPELHPLYDSVSDYVGEQCAEFANDTFGEEVFLLKSALSDVWEALKGVWRDIVG